MKRIRLITDFYRTYLFTAWLATALACYLVAANGKAAFTAAIWNKIVITAIVVLYQHFYGRNYYAYFGNIGLRPRHLWGFSLLADLLIFISAFALTIRLWGSI